MHRPVRGDHRPGATEGLATPRPAATSPRTVAIHAREDGGDPPGEPAPATLHPETGEPLVAADQHADAEAVEQQARRTATGDHEARHSIRPPVSSPRTGWYHVGKLAAGERRRLRIPGSWRGR